MSNTVKAGLGVLNVTFDGATAWDLASSSGLTRDLTNGIKVRFIQMIPTATDDKLIVRETDANGAVLFNGLATNKYDRQILYFNDATRLYKLYVTGTDASNGLMMIVGI